MTETRPLVTFALFAYNQEKYIREAVEGAFSQTYEPLEIILSDDCSTDRTFEIMQEMAAAYQGPHSVRVNRPPENVGTVAHILNVARQARGEIFVLAAGDDISVPMRSSAIVPYFEDPSVWAISSNDQTLIEEGLAYRDQNFHDALVRMDAVPEKLLGGAHFTNIHGATSAYRREFLLHLSYPEKKILIEDYPFALLVHLLGGKVQKVPQTLVRYRWHGDNLSIRDIQEPSCDPMEYEKRLASKRAKMADALEYLLGESERLCSLRPAGATLDRPVLMRKVAFLRLASEWWMLAARDRMRLLLLSARDGRLSTGVARMLGSGVFIMQARLRRKLR